MLPKEKVEIAQPRRSTLGNILLDRLKKKKKNKIAEEVEKHDEAAKNLLGGEQIQRLALSNDEDQIDLAL